MKLTPITSKIKRTTKGGMVQQPLLNMGAPVKMKMSSPAKQGGRNSLTKEQKEQRNYNKNKIQYDKDTKYMTDNPASQKHQSYLDKGGRGDWLSSYDNAYSRSKEFKNSEGYKKRLQKETTPETNKTLTAKNLKARSEGEAGWAADDKARKNKTGLYKPTAGKKSYDQAYKDSRNVKEYAGMSKAEYIKEAKRQTASKKAGKGWDAKRSKKEAVKPAKGAGIKGAETKTIKTKAKATSTSKKEITSKNNSSSFINNKRTADIVKGKVNAKPAKEVESKKVKKSTKVKYDPSTGTGGSVAGNLIRSITGSRRRDRENAAERKAKGQASKAVSTDSKVDFKQFIGKTKETPAKKKKSAAKKKK